jgi:hypothetical protein
VSQEKQFAVVHSPYLEWPSPLVLPSRFRLFVAANITDINADVVSEFAVAALSRGMVYFCSWGLGCERFHDIVDEVIAEDDVSQRRFAGPTKSDTVIGLPPTLEFGHGSERWLACALVSLFLETAQGTSK